MPDISTILMGTGPDSEPISTGDSGLTRDYDSGNTISENMFQVLSERPDTTARSQEVAFFHDQLDVFTTPESAAFVGRLLDKGFVSTEELYTWIKVPEDLRGLLRVARARFLQETSKGYRPEPAAASLADQIIRASET